MPETVALRALLFPLLLGLAALGGETSPDGPEPVPDRVSGAPPPHDLHVSYGNLGVEGSIAILQVRLFKDDLEEALRRLAERDTYQMSVSPETDALFLRYLSEKFILEVESEILEGRVLGSGEDELEREPVWWYQIRFDAPDPIQAAHITNTLLFELFPDQRNVLRVVEFPEEKRQAFYFARGEETIRVEF